MPGPLEGIIDQPDPPHEPFMADPINPAALRSEAAGSLLTRLFGSSASTPADPFGPARRSLPIDVTGRSITMWRTHTVPESRQRALDDVHVISNFMPVVSAIWRAACLLCTAGSR